MFIYDIGANRGYFTDKCLSLFPDVKILVVEPNNHLFEGLNYKYQNNQNIIVSNKLISDTDDNMIDFYMNQTIDVISTASIDWIKKSRFSNQTWNEPIKLKTTTLNKLISEYGEPDLIKIDVEGYEYEVVKGLNQKVTEICFEWAEEQYTTINKIIEHLESLGYTEFGYIDGDDYMKRPEIYTSWKDSSFHEDIDQNRKQRWGMIWAK